MSYGIRKIGRSAWLKVPGILLVCGISLSVVLPILLAAMAMILLISVLAMLSAVPVDVAGMMAYLETVIGARKCRNCGK